MLTAKEQLYQHIEELPAELAQEVLDFLLFVKTRRDRAPLGTPGKAFLTFVGLFPKSDLAEMTQAIEEGCNQIDVNEW